MDTVIPGKKSINGLIFLSLCYTLAVLCGVLFVLFMIPIVVHYHDLSTDHWMKGWLLMTKTDEQVYCFLVPFVIWTGSVYQPHETSGVEWVLTMTREVAQQVAQDRLAVRFGRTMVALKLYEAIMLPRDEVAFLAATYGLIDVDPSTLSPTELSHCKVLGSGSGPQV